MNNLLKSVLGISAFTLMGLVLDINACAAPGSTIESGVFADDIDLSGMTEDEADAAVNARVEERRNANITLTDGNDYSISFTAGDIGYSWANTELVSDALRLGKSGNVVERYKALKDLSREKQVYDIDYSMDTAALSGIITNCAEEYNEDAVNASLSRVNGAFEIVDGSEGRRIDEQSTLDYVADYIDNSWDGSDVTLDMTVETVEPEGKAEDLAKVGDVLGKYTTSYSTSGASRSANIANACSFINGTTLLPGEEFSTLDTITPFSEANGYYLAGSYLNGQVVESLGGGICQVSTTLYNAVLLSELEVTERHNHSMIISYVKPSMDAAIAESSGKNFRFVNNTDYPIYIEGYTADKTITFVVYGVETRPASHSVSYESETLEVDNPETDMIYTDASQPAGYCSNVTSAHIGYKAKLWKNTYENGELTDRVEVNSSVYNKAPRSVTIGVSTDNVDVYNMLMAAAASNNIDTAKAAAGQAAAILAGQQAAPAADTQTVTENVVQTETVPDNTEPQSEGESQ